jgi:hypothetical protein
MELINTPEFQLIIQLLSPDYLWSAAKNYGDGDAIKGSRKAYYETRKIIRLLVNQAREREKKEKGLDKLPKDLELAFLIKSLGWPIFAQVPELVQIEDEGWRKLAATFWPQGTPINGGFYMPVNTSCFEKVYEAAILATSQLLHDVPALNQAYLDGRVWQRADSLVMVHFEVRKGLVSMVMDAQKRDVDWVHKKLRKGFRTAVQFSKTEMSKYSTHLMIEWAKTGFLGSPAGAMVSGAPGIEQGWGALVPCNGIPLVICVNQPIDGKVYIGVTPDHRVFDGKVAGVIHKYLRGSIMETLYV